MDSENSDEKQLVLNNDARNTKMVTANLVFATASVVIGSSFQFGYNTGVVNAPEVVIEGFLNGTYKDRYGYYLDESELKWLWALIVSMFAVGGMVGSFVAGYLADRFGRKKSLLFNNSLVFVGVVLMAVTKLSGLYELLILGRIIIGFNTGINTGLTPLYLTEIAPVDLRGILGTLHQMGIVTSLLLSQVLGLPQVLGTTELWPLLLSVPAIFAVFQLLTLPFCPETAPFLSKINQESAAKNALLWLRGNSNVEDEMADIQTQQRTGHLESKVNLKTIFTTGYLFRPLLVAIVMQCSQQLSGINAVYYYSTSIFISAGISKVNSTYATVGIGVTNIVMVLVSLALIERAGRKTLHLIGLGGMFVCMTLLVFTFNLSYLSSSLSVVSVIAVFTFVIFFQVGPGSIPWFITAELFKENARSTAISIAGLVNWLCNFAVGLGYPPIENAIHGYTFIIFAVLLVIFLIFTYFKVPETKGKSIIEITEYFKSS